MNSRGDKSYWRCVRRFVLGYLATLALLMVGLLVVDAVFPGADVYGRIGELLVRR